MNFAQVLEVKSVNTNEDEVQVQEEPKYKPLFKTF